MDLTPVVISDIHSRQGKLTKLLVEVGVLEQHSITTDQSHEKQAFHLRSPGFQLIQVGDAVSAGYGMKEAGFYQWWTSLLNDDDIELVGNHEAPIIYHYDQRLQFYGYNHGDMGTSGCDPALKHLVLARQKKYRAAHAVDDWLITHAGVRSRYLKTTPHGYADAQLTSDYLNDLWDQHLGPKDDDHLLDCAICNPYHGILWTRDLEKTSTDPARVKQIFGHTPDGPTLGRDGTMWNIDTPRLTPAKHGSGYARAEAEEWGGVSALVRDDSEPTGWKLHYVE